MNMIVGSGVTGPSTVLTILLPPIFFISHPSTNFLAELDHFLDVNLILGSGVGGPSTVLGR